ncbi:MAG: phospholipase [Gemmatimonadota bacterium]|nr:phospholipase [Gemmatimonadota bacterium]
MEVPKTARYLTLGPDSAPDVWIVLHGYGQLARRFLRRFEPVDDGSRYIVAPEALSRFYAESESGRHGPGSIVGATWMTREARDDEIADYVRYLDLLADRVLGRHRRLTVLGFSQGVATACRWTVRGNVQPDRIVLWGDFLPPDLDFQVARERWAAVETVLVRGREDHALRSKKLAVEEAERVEAAGLDLRTVRYEGGHDIDARALAGLTKPSSE